MTSPYDAVDAQGKVHIYRESECHRCGRGIIMMKGFSRWVHDGTLAMECATARPMAEPDWNEVREVARVEDVVL